jgi:hypothetical protein
MSYFAVTRSAGPAWTDGGIAAQPAVDDHATAGALAATHAARRGSYASQTESGAARPMVRSTGGSTTQR